MKYTIEYTLPNERGKIHKATVDGKDAYTKKLASIKAKGGNIKSTSSH